MVVVIDEGCDYWCNFDLVVYVVDVMILILCVGEMWFWVDMIMICDCFDVLLLEQVKVFMV